MAGLNIDFANLDDHLLEELPIGPAEQALNEQIGSGSANSLSCYALLDSETQATIVQDAESLYERMVSDTAFLMEYGQDAVDSMNQLVDTLFSKVDPIEIPEITELMENLTHAMGTLHEK